jgi:hypothetical protein
MLSSTPFSVVVVFDAIVIKARCTVVALVVLSALFSVAPPPVAFSIAVGAFGAVTFC